MMYGDVDDVVFNSFKRVAFEIIDTILVQMKERFQDTNSIRFLN